MKALGPYNCEWTNMECSAGHAFQVDATTEENLQLHEAARVLVPVCPTCGERGLP